VIHKLYIHVVGHANSEGELFCVICS